MDRSNRFFAGPPTTFEEAYPNVEDAIIEWKESTLGINPSGLGRASIKELGGLIQCRNPLCRRGGFEIDFELGMMIRKKETVKEDMLVCPGDEGSPKGRRPGKRCLNGIKYKITVTYK